MRVESFKIKGWENLETGLVIAENTDWVLVRHVPVDYAIDGYKLYRKKYIKKRISKGKELLRLAHVLKLKEIKTAPPIDFKFWSSFKLLKNLESQYQTVEFQTQNEYQSFYGVKFKKEDEDHFKTLLVNIDGHIESDWSRFTLDDIRILTFKTDYFDSMCLLMQSSNRINF